MKKGKFIVVDGGEGSGKGTVLAELARVLDPDVAVFTREPGGTPRAEKIREAIMFDKGASALTNFLLFCAARSDHVEYRIRPTLESGKHVICDRFDMSTFAYQIHGQENHFLYDLFHHVRDLLGSEAVPDLYIYLDVNPSVGLERARGRGDGNHFDNAELDFHERVRKGYLEFIKHHPHVVIDAGRTQAEVQKEFIELVSMVLFNSR